MTRQWKREVISRCYNLLVKLLFRNGFSDAQCGFKAVKRGVARKLLAGVEDNEWFFDTELLLLAEERGYRISEVPVDWVEDLDSRVEIGPTALKDVKGLLRVREERNRRRRRLFGRRTREDLDGARHARPGAIDESTLLAEAGATSREPLAVVDGSSKEKGGSGE